MTFPFTFSAGNVRLARRNSQAVAGVRLQQGAALASECKNPGERLTEVSSS